MAKEKLCEQLYGADIPYGYVGRGKTLTEARTMTVNAMARDLEGSYTPIVGHFLGYTFLIWREPNWYHGKILDVAENRNLSVKRIYCGHQGVTEKEVLGALLLAIAEIDYEIGTRATDSFRFHSAKDQLSAENQTEFDGWAKWQDEYRILRDEGYSDNDARYIISGLKAKEDCQPTEAKAISSI